MNAYANATRMEDLRIQEVTRTAHEYCLQQPDLPWGEALRVAEKHVTGGGRLLLENSYRITPMPDLMERKRDIYLTLADRDPSAAGDRAALYARIELDVINQEIERRH